MEGTGSGSIEYIKGLRCGIENCKARKYYIEGGFTYCKNGHQQDIGPQTQQDEDGFVHAGGNTTRRKRELLEPVSHNYSGAQAVQLYLQAYQFILWKQCYALIHTIGLPAELERVVKDLWALRLQLVKDKIDEDFDADVLFSSQPESETEEEGEDDDGAREWGVKGKDMPMLIETLGLCYLGIIILRLPVRLGDFYRWALREHIPFIKVSRFVPRVMWKKLPGEFKFSLESKMIMKPNDFRKSVHRLVLFYDHRFGMTLPALNYPLLLFSYVKDLALPLEICSAVYRISSLLEIKFDFPRPGSRSYSSKFPETQLIALLLVAVKLFHPFDQLQRKHRSWTEPGALNIDWNVWCDLQTKHEARFTSDGRIGRGNIISVNEQDIMKMSGAQLDEYMDWCERTLVREDLAVLRKEGISRDLVLMFPTGRLDGSSFAETNFDEESKIDQVSVKRKLAKVQRSLLMRDVVSEEQEENSNKSKRRTKSSYIKYSKAEDLTPQARKFHQTAASLASISLSSLLFAVVGVENELVKRERKEKGKRKRGRTRERERGKPRRKQLSEDHEDSGSEVSRDPTDIDDEDDRFPNDGDESDGEEKDD